MLLRAIPGPKGDKGAYYCKINIPLAGRFQCCSLHPAFWWRLSAQSWEPGTGLCRQGQGMTLGSGEEHVRAPVWQVLSLWGRQEGSGR